MENLCRERIDRLTGLMQDEGWDLLVFYGNPWRRDHFRYIVNFNFSCAHALAILDRSGEVRTLMSHPWDAELVNGSFAPAQHLERSLAGLTGRIAVAGLEFMDTRYAISGAISATAQIEEMRRVKTLEEITALRRAAELADRGWEFFARTAEPGLAEFELVAEVEAFLKRNGAEDNFMLIGSGGVEVTGMKPPTERKLQNGDFVTTELTPQVDGYYAQICRTLVMGEPNPHQRKSFHIFADARQAAEDVLKPGIDIAEVARVQNDVFRKFGYGDYTGPEYTRVRGHGLGLYPDETPHVLENVHYTVRKDMVMIAHPNTYLPLGGYMVFGDTLRVTEDGCEPLNHTERKLFQR